MTLIMAVCVPTAIIISGDSRTMLTITNQPPLPAPAQPQPTAQQSPASPQSIAMTTNLVISDATDKVFLLFGKYGIGVFGEAMINNMPIAHAVEDFEATHGQAPPTTPQAFANDLLTYFRSLSPIPQVSAIIGGYDNLDPWVIEMNVSANTTNRANVDPQTGNITYITYSGGDNLISQRLLSNNPFHPLCQAMNIQDGVDLSRHIIRTTIDQMRFEPRFATVGGPIDTLVITPSNPRFLIHKALQAI